MARFYDSITTFTEKDTHFYLKKKPSYLSGHVDGEDAVFLGVEAVVDAGGDRRLAGADGSDQHDGVLRADERLRQVRVAHRVHRRHDHLEERQAASKHTSDDHVMPPQRHRMLTSTRNHHDRCM